jgi:hypothetical protein
MTGSELIADIRESAGDIPTGFYDAAGIPQPALDGGLLRAQTIVRWINQAQSIIGIVLKGMEDWTAFPGLLNQDVYSIDPRWFDLESGILCYDGWETTGPPLIGEADLMPVQNLVTGLSLGWSISRTVPPLRIRFWPAPGRTPGASTLSVGINATVTSLQVVSVTTFGLAGAPNYGWLRITSAAGIELVRYQILTTATRTFSVLSRGEGGTRALAHLAGATVEEANVWVKGKRIPTPLGLPQLSQLGTTPVLVAPGYQTGSYQLTLTEPMELPDYFSHTICDWCVSRARGKENDDSAAQSLRKMVVEDLKLSGGARRRPRIGQAKPFGSGTPGLFFGRIIVP